MTRFCMLPVVLLMLPGGCTGQTLSSGATPEARSGTPFDGPERTTLSQPVVTVPLTKVGDFYYTQVLLNGRSFRFTVETGAGFFAISGRAANALGLRADSISVSPGTRSPVVRLDSMNLGSATFYGLVGRITSRWDVGDMDGIISVPVLRDVLATLDLGASRLVLERGALPAPNGRDVLPIARRDRGGRIDVPMDLAGIATNAVLDTRSFYWITASDSLLGTLRLQSPPRPLGTAYGPAMGTFEVRGARVVGGLRIGQYEVEQPPVVFRDRSGFVVGVPFLEQFVVTIDQRNQRIRFSRRDAATTIAVPALAWESGDTARVPPAMAATERAAPTNPDGPRRVAVSGGQPASGQRTMGFGIAAPPGGGALRIVNVARGSSAEKVGIREGDQLLELDGTPAAAMSPAVVRAAVARGGPVKVVVLRDGSRLELSVEPYQVP
jgi:hypothetical protein